MSNFATRIAKILVSEKRNDFFIKSKVYDPDTEQEAALGKMLLLIEIKSDWYLASQIAQKITDTAISAYYGLKNAKNTLNRFEEALKVVNEELAHLAEKGDNSWVGKMSAAIIIIKENKLYLTQAGSPEGYLLRDQNLTSIIEKEAKSEDNDVLKTFQPLLTAVWNLAIKLFSPTLIFTIIFLWQKPKKFSKMLNRIKQLTVLPKFYDKIKRITSTA